MLITATGLGRCVGLDVDGAELAAVRPWLPYWWVDAPGEPERVWPVTAADAEQVVAELELWVAEHAVGVVVVHAGVVVVDGRALLLPARSYAGKSTLTAALVRAGAVYGSDEYAPLLPDGRVVAYPRPLGLREAGGRRRVPAHELGGSVLADPAPVGAIAALRHDASAGWDVTPSTPGGAALALVDNCVPARSRPEEMLTAVAAACGSADLLLRGTRGDADDAAARLLRQLRAGARSSG